MNAQSPVEASPLSKLREPFPPHQISKLPKPYKRDSAKGNCKECGGYHGLPAVHLDYVGHAALTDRLLDTDPEWNWEPMGLNPDGTPALDRNGGLWIKLTVCGVTRPGYGCADGKSGGDAMKEIIGDALRNAAMRFGAALDLWHKGDLHLESEVDDDGGITEDNSGDGKVSRGDPVEHSDEPVNDRAPRGRGNGPTKSKLDAAENEIVRELMACGDEDSLIAYLETAEYKASKALLEEHRPSALFGPPPEHCPEYVPIKTMITRMVNEFRGPVRELSPVEAG